MLTKVDIRNFKRFRSAEIELGETVVFIGPNNSGKTTALQSLALWNLGVRRLAERHGTAEPPTQRPGVAINRKDLIALPVSTSTMLWRDSHAFQKAHRVPIEIVAHGVDGGATWSYGVEFGYDNEESIVCRPMKLSDQNGKRMSLPEQARRLRLAFLPPMSGLVANETKLEPGAIAVRIGEGRTAEILRNLCHRVASEAPASWQRIVDDIDRLFRVRLHSPDFLVDRGEITMTYRERGVTLDLSAAGRGLQQTLLLLTYLRANPGSAILLDEPDAHLEILRQRQIYEIITALAAEESCQIIAASHSEVLLNEAADRDMVVAFVGSPHRIDDRGTQLLKSLTQVGFEHYYQAEQRGWVLYLEGSTDLAILRSFARTLEHPAKACLEQPFVHYVGNQIRRAHSHFAALREAKKDLVAISVLDRDAQSPQANLFRELRWERNEIENYLCFPEVLEAYAASFATNAAGPLFERQYREMMKTIIEEEMPPAALSDLNHRWWRDMKATDQFLDPVFAKFFDKLGIPNMMRKTDYHRLAPFVPAERISTEIFAALDAIAETAAKARPLVESD